MNQFERWIDDYLNLILDKISGSGISSLREMERDFLSAYSSGDVQRMEYIERIEGQKIFKSTDDLFEFRYSHSEDFGDEGIFYYGSITVPNLEISNHKKIDGNLEGYIWVIGDIIMPIFEKDKWDILDFCNGFEYELDLFLEYVISTIEDEKSC